MPRVSGRPRGRLRPWSSSWQWMSVCWFYRHRRSSLALGSVSGSPWIPRERRSTRRHRESTRWRDAAVATRVVRPSREQPGASSELRGLTQTAVFHSAWTRSRLNRPSILLALSFPHPFIPSLSLSLSLYCTPVPSTLAGLSLVRGPLNQQPPGRSALLRARCSALALDLPPDPLPPLRLPPPPTQASSILSLTSRRPSLPPTLLYSLCSLLFLSVLFYFPLHFSPSLSHPRHGVARGASVRLTRMLR